MRYDPLVVRTAFLLLLVSLLAGADLVGVEPELGGRLVDEALSIGHSRIQAVRARFHEPYRIQIGSPPIDYIDVVTPFRRVVLLAEERTRAGSRLQPREAFAQIEGRAMQIELRVEATFHPLNAFVGVPAYDVLLRTDVAGMPFDPLRIDLVPRFGARLDGMPAWPSAAGTIASPDQPLLGGTLVATFSTDGLNPTGRYEVVVSEDGSELTRARIDLGTMR
ncbi:MAG: hypothetical protein O2930_04700 [Acidobacteria bacterium]|nr:hypothetical protein [Acidobacteriota bacterium]